MLENIEKLLNKINQLITLIGGAAIFLMVLHVTVDIIWRFFFNIALPGTISIVSHYYMLIAIFLPLAYVEQTKASISVDLLSNFLSQTIKNLIETIANLFIALTAFVITYVSAGVSLENFNSKSSVMQGDYTIPTWPSYFILTFGAALLGIYCSVKFLNLLIYRNKNK